jgi:hypothetical protein
MTNVQENVGPTPVTPSTPATPQPSIRDWLVPPVVLPAAILLVLGFMVAKQW